MIKGIIQNDGLKESFGIEDTTFERQEE